MKIPMVALMAGAAGFLWMTGYSVGRIHGAEEVLGRWELSRIYDDAVAIAEFQPGDTGVQISTTLGRQAAVECYQIHSKRHLVFLVDSITVKADRIAISFQSAVSGGKCVLRRRYDYSAQIASQIGGWSECSNVWVDKDGKPKENRFTDVKITEYK